MNLLPPSKSRGRTSNVSSSPVFLPNELIAEVLSFLRVKPLMRLKCVSKSWNSLISDPTFIKLHLNRSSRRNTDRIFVFNASWHRVRRAVYFTVICLHENPPIIINLPEDPYYYLKDKDCCYIVGSCNGLLCLLGYSYKDFWLRFWNPATRKISEKLGFCYQEDGLGHRSIFKFGYDNSTNTYKVVCFRPATTNVRIFNLGDNVWRDIQNSPVVHRLYKMGVVHLSGSVNWLGIRNYNGNGSDYDCKDITIEQFVIISLDLGTETHSELLPPQGFKEVPFVIPNLSVLKDCLCFSHDFKQTHFVIWQMKEFRVEESWTLFLKISYHNLEIDYHFNDLNFYLSTLCLSEKNDTLLLTTRFDRQAILYNWRDNRAKKINKSWWHNNVQEYVESLVTYC